MNTVSAVEVKQRGVIALEEGLKKGPLHIIKNSRLACVVLTEEDYMALVNKSKTTQTGSLWNLLEHRPWTGKRTKNDINKQMKEERVDWQEEV